MDALGWRAQGQRGRDFSPGATSPICRSSNWCREFSVFWRRRDGGELVAVAAGEFIVGWLSSGRWVMRPAGWRCGSSAAADNRAGDAENGKRLQQQRLRLRPFSAWLAPS